MTKSKEVQGLLYADRNPKPKPSPKKFTWPPRDGASDQLREALAASLQELLPKKGWTHIDLARNLFGANEGGVPRNIANPRAWVKAKGPFPTEEQAGFTAELLGVSMQRLLEPKGEFDPNPSMVRPRPGAGEGKTKRTYNKRAVNDPDDTRWVLPEGVDPPKVDMKTTARADWVAFSIAGEMPTEIAMAILSMARCRAGMAQS